MAVAPLVTAWSYSRFADYDQCPAKFKYKHLDKLPDPGSPAMQRGNVIHKLAENAVKAAKGVVPAELKHFKAEIIHLRTVNPMVEQAWGFKKDFTHTGRNGWFGDDVWFRAKADVFATYDDNTADLIDWKTGKKYETNKDQMELFSLAGFMRVPTLKSLTTRLWYVDQSEDNEVAEEYTRADAERIARDWQKKVVPMFTDRKFPPRPNSKCGWCSFSKAKGGPCKF